MIGILLTILFYILALWLRKKLKNPLLNPVLVAAICIITFLSIADISYDTYKAGAGIIGQSLGPIVVLLALPLYNHRKAIKQHFVPILIGIGVSMVSSGIIIVLLVKVFGLSTDMLMTLLPKSITTPMAMEVSSMLDGISDITVIIVIITGILGATIAPLIMTVGKVKSDIAKGISIGATAHGIGTSKAMEMSEKAGAMSGLAMGLTGVIYVLIASLYVLVFK